MSTIKKIAELAGVSQATVSRVLNNPNYHCSSPEKRDKIWKAAMQLNYVPNEAAKNLKKGGAESREKAYRIGVLMTRMDNAEADPFFTELLRIIETEIHRRFCILAKVWYLPVFSDARKYQGKTLEKAVDDMQEDEESAIDGLIIIGRCSKEGLAKLKGAFQYVIAVNRNPQNFEIDEVICDGKKVAAQAVEYLISLGHHEIGYVGECHNEARYRGYIGTLEKHGLEAYPAYVYETKQTEAEGFETMSRILKSDNIPTAIFCANDITAIGMLSCLKKKRNRSVSISIIASDDIEAAQFTSPMLTTIALPKDEMGRFAVHLLLDRMKGGHKHAVKLELPGELVKRGSCRQLQESIDYYI